MQRARFLPGLHDDLGQPVERAALPMHRLGFFLEFQRHPFVDPALPSQLRTATAMVFSPSCRNFRTSKEGWLL